jgi:CheY-specific phosphatase CheX
MQGARLDTPAVRQALEEAVLEVLETMCFEFPIDEPFPGGPPGDNAVQAVARFDGTIRGALRVALTGQAAKRLAAAFLGLEEDQIGGPETLQMASELANMLCGATMSRLEPHGRLRIAPPEAGWGGTPCAGHCWLHFPLEQGEAAVTLAWEQES